MTNTQKNQSLRTLGSTQGARLPRHFKQPGTRGFSRHYHFYGKSPGHEVASNVTYCKFTFDDKGSNQRCSFSQKRKNTLNHRYMETTTKPPILVRKLHKHRRSRLSSFFEKHYDIVSRNVASKTVTSQQTPKLF